MSPATEQIAREIAAEGSISFARFMELALYAPGSGYYERQQQVGRAGDFYTNVSVGEVFGDLLACQFAQWADGGALQLIEAGAHRGTLAVDILGWLKRWQPAVAARTEYFLVEPSEARRAWQRQTLAPAESPVRWVSRLSEIPEPPGRRIIFSNELLDAMPVHRLSWDAARRGWNECRVAQENGTFAWRSAPWPEAVPAVDPALAEILPDKYIIEHSPAAAVWWSEAAHLAARPGGKLLTFDYGFTALEKFQPERTNGTLRAYSRHQIGDDVLNRPGDCDLTAHVDFSTVMAAGESAGLRTEHFTEQGKYLTGIFAQTVANPAQFPAWSPERLRQFQTLTHPQHLGRAFRVLVQSGLTAA